MTQGAAVEQEAENSGGWGGDVLAAARKTVRDVMEGRGGRNSIARLHAAKLVLDKDSLIHVSDEALLAEVDRRAAARARIGQADSVR